MSVELNADRALVITFIECITTWLLYMGLSVKHLTTVR